MFGLPLMFWLPVVFLFGTIVGSFLNVVICRLHTGRSLSGHSHCLSCGHGLSWYELFPLVSYLALRGRCQRCGAYIPARYFMVEFLTGLSFMLPLYITTDLVLLLLLATVLSILVVITVYDLYHMIIPDEQVLVLTMISILITMYLYWSNLIQELFVSIMAGTVASLFFWSLWYYSKGRWIGLGDAKLAFPLGILTGLSGVFSLIVLSFWIGAITSVSILFLQAVLNRGQKHLQFLPRTLKMKSEIPFAPFLIGAFVLVYFFGIDVLALTAEVTSLLYDGSTY